MIGSRLARIELEAFRGFADSRSIDLDADVVVMRGDNGSGKTSVIDGLIWLACGELEHLTSRVRGLRRAEDVLVNRYVGPPARVRLVLFVEGSAIEFERSGTAKKSTLRAWHEGEELPQAETALARALGDFPAQALANAVRTWGVLRQDAVRAALESGGALHERLAAVVGLERVTLFAQAASDAASRLTRERTRARKTRDELLKRAERATARIEDAQRASPVTELSVQLIAARLEAISIDLPNGINMNLGLAPDRHEVSRLASAAGDLVQAVSVVADRAAALHASDESAGMAVERAEASVASARAGVGETMVDTTRRQHLAAAALDQLGDTCPVCGQSINEATVRAHLLEELRESEAAHAAGVQAQKALAEAETALARSRAVLQARLELIASANQAIDELRVREADVDAFNIDESWLALERSSELKSVLSGVRSRLLELGAELESQAHERTLRTTSETAALQESIDEAQRAVAEVEARCERASALDKAAHAAAQRIVEAALRRLEPTFAEVFDRLAPHPTFTELRARQDIFYGKNQIVPEVFDPERRVTGNPMLVFSEGQLNVVALSYFLGLALNAREGGLPFIALDDPLQSMDVLGVLGFADLCRRIREQRQLVVTTHDRRFAEILSRKLAPREEGMRTLLHEFDGWTREGPRIESTEAPLAEVIPLLRPAA